MATILDVVEALPDGLAVDDLERTRTWSELLDRAQRVGGLLRSLGIGPGGHAAQLMGNRVELIELALGASLAGSWLTPINWHLVADEVAYILEDSGAGVLLTEPQHEVVAREAAARARGVRVLVAGPELDDALASVDPLPIDLDAPSGGSMFYTSGTTGRPKGVRRLINPTVGAWLAQNRSGGRALGLDGRGPHLVTGPLYHAAPLGYAVMDQHNGAPMVIMDRWDEARCLELLVERAVRNTHLVPTMFVRLLRLPDEVREAFDPSTLRTVLHGAAPISPAVKRRMIEWWGPKLVEYWGASEGGVVTLVGSEDWLAHPGTVGRALPTHEVFAGTDDGTPLPAGEQGLLWCRNHQTARVFEYHNAPEKTDAAHPVDHVYSLGDIGRVDDDGWVFLSDRVSHMIISGGVNIYPAEVEHVLVAHPAVADAGVFGIPDEEWGEQVKAAVELCDGHEPSDELAADILAHCHVHLARFKVPRSVDFHDELPRQPTGKLFKQQLRAPYWVEADRSI